MLQYAATFLTERTAAVGWSELMRAVNTRAPFGGGEGLRERGWEMFQTFDNEIRYYDKFCFKLCMLERAALIIF